MLRTVRDTLCTTASHLLRYKKNKETLSINQRQTVYLEAIDLLTCRQVKDEPDLIVITQNVFVATFSNIKADALFRIIKQRDNENIEQYFRRQESVKYCSESLENE